MCKIHVCSISTACPYCIHTVSGHNRFLDSPSTQWPRSLVRFEFEAFRNYHVCCLILASKATLKRKTIFRCDHFLITPPVLEEPRFIQLVTTNRRDSLVCLVCSTGCPFIEDGQLVNLIQIFLGIFWFEDLIQSVKDLVKIFEPVWKKLKILNICMFVHSSFVDLVLIY